MEAWTVIFRNLYTGFLLRDFAGKIVPGIFLLFSIAAIFGEPRAILADAKKEAPIFVVLLLAAFAWTVTLGTQSLAEGLGIWQYFPSDAQGPGQAAPRQGFWGNLLSPAPDGSFDRDTLRVDEFQSKASEDEKQQYERFVVIKEACGNLFVAMVLSIPAWIVRAVIKERRGGLYRRRWKYASGVKIALASIYGLLILVGLHRMHTQHVYRQMKFADDIAQRHKGLPESHPATIHVEVEQK